MKRPVRNLSVAGTITSFVLILLANDSATADDATTATMAAIKRGLPYVMERGNWWIDKKDCVSCHRVSFQLWAHADARSRGFDVDSVELKELAEWSVSALRKEDDKGKATGLKNPEGASQMLAALQNVTDLMDTESANQSMIHWLQTTQQPDGSWKPAGQLPKQKRSVAETTLVSTMWNVSLAADAGLSDAATQSAIRFARKTIDATSSEWLTTRVLFLNRFGTPEETQTAVQALLAEQNDDGGWGWLRQQDSDAIATGQILWVLHQANQQQAAEQNLHKAVNWLIAAQIEDGSWPTKGTKKNAQDKVVETATFWGSAWATIGLLQTLPVDGTATE